MLPELKFEARYYIEIVDLNAFILTDHAWLFAHMSDCKVIQIEGLKVGAAI